MTARVHRLPTPDDALESTLEASVRRVRLERARAVYAEATAASDDAQAGVVIGQAGTYARALAAVSREALAARALVALLDE